MAGSAQVFRSGTKVPAEDERNAIAQRWQIDMYRYAQIIGEARYSAIVFSNMAGRAEIGVSEAQALASKAVWVESGPEVDEFATLAPTVRERTKLIRDYMLHWVIAGECYLVARERRSTDPGYQAPPLNPVTEKPYRTWDEYQHDQIDAADLLDPDFDPSDVEGNPNIDNPIWEIVSVMEIRHIGDVWEVQHDNGVWLPLHKNDPVIRMWNPAPGNRREAWSAFYAMRETLREIEWLTRDIFTQVRSRMKHAGVWFLPDNMTYPKPPLDVIKGENPEETLAAMNESEQFQLALAAASTELLDGDTVAFPTVVMVDPLALANVDKSKLITFWNELDAKVTEMRSDAIRRFALGMDMPPEQVLGSSGLAVSGSSGSNGSVNHWGVWANEEQTISVHIEPALDVFVEILTNAFLRPAVPETTLVIGYNTASLRLRQDRSEESIKLYELGLLKGEVTLRECGFDPTHDMMDDKELARMILVGALRGSWTPEQMGVMGELIGIAGLTGLPGVSGNPGGVDGKSQPTNTDGIENRGAPEEQHDHSPAPFSAVHAASEALVVRALEKNGAKLLNSGLRGRERDRKTPPIKAHVVLKASGDLERTVSSLEFDFSSAMITLGDLPRSQRKEIVDRLARFCADLTNKGQAYERQALTPVLEDVA